VTGPIELPSEILLRSPRSDTDGAFEDLAARVAQAVGGVPIRVIHGNGASDDPPLPGAALVTGGQPGVREILDRMPAGGRGWSWIHLTSSGPDHFRNFGPLPEGALLTYARGVNARSMAEWVLASLLHFQRDFDRYVRAQAEVAGGGEVGWDRAWARELSGQVAAVLGAGAAGTELAILLSTLGMRVTGVSRSGRSLPGFDQVVTPDRTRELLGAADVAIVLLPLTDETRRNFGDPEVRAMKRGSILVVASRGGIVDEGAVAAALHDGHLRGAAFDVFEDESLPPTSPLWTAPRTLLTPHVAGTTDRFMENLARNIRTVWMGAFVDGDLEGLKAYRYR
jgi:phosphoglycerate dehydrogenase-like enzyme